MNYGSGSGTLLLAVKFGIIPGTLFFIFILYFPYETYINIHPRVELRLLGIILSWVFNSCVWVNNSSCWSEGVAPYNSPAH
jgi:hypothetical protein